MTWETWLRLLGETSLRGSILICLLALFRPIIHRLAGARVMHWLWLLVAIHLVLPFKIIVPLALYRAMPATLKINASIWQKNPDGNSPVAVKRAAPRAPRQDAAFPLTTLAAAVWAGGALAMLAVLLGADWSFRRRLRAEGTPPDERTRALVAAKAAELGLRRVQTLETDLTPGPAVFGLWRPRLLLPRGLAEKLDDAELRLVLLHELGHLKRGDLWQQTALLAALTLHWFNPLVWLAARLARSDRELACDEFVLERAASDEAPVYDKTLLRVLGLARPGRPALPAAGIIETRTELKQRLDMIHQHRPFTKTRALCGAAFLFTLGTAFVTAKGQAPASPSPSPAAPSPRQVPAGELSAAEAYGRQPNIAIQAMVFAVQKGEALEFTATPQLDSDPAKAVENLLALVKTGKAEVIASPAVTTRSGQKSSSTTGSTKMEVEPVLSPAGDKISINVVNFQYGDGQISTSFLVNNGDTKFIGAFDSEEEDKNFTCLVFVRARAKN